MVPFQIIAFLISLFLFLATRSFIILRRCKSGRKLAPGPVGIPIIGHLHLLGLRPHLALHRLAQKHGPIMSLRLGLKPLIVVSCPNAVELFLKTHEMNFSSRPKSIASNILGHGARGLAFSDYGPYWRSLRRLCNLELMSPAMIDGFKGMRRNEVQRLVGRLMTASGAVVDVSGEVARTVADMSCITVFGKCSDQRFDMKGVLKEAVKMVGGALNIADILPFLGPLDIQGLTRRLKATSKKLDNILEMIIDDHEEDSSRKENQQKDFIPILLSLHNSNNNAPDHLPCMTERETIKAMVLDLILASFDTPAISIEWIMSELLRSPKTMQKLQVELSNVIGKDRMVEEADLARLEYLDFVIKETFRLHPILIPRVCHEDITIDGYFIEKNSTVLINTWSLGRDKKVWDEKADQFIPERFSGSDIDFKGTHLKILPFGSGRRGCPAVNLGLITIQLVVAQLIQCFDWELPKGTSTSDLDMNEKFGFTLSRDKHLCAIPTYRLHI